MTDPEEIHPFGDEFADVLGALERTQIALPASLEATLKGSVRAAAEESERPVAASIKEAITRDADEAWSLALTFLGDPEAAWEAVADGFTRLGRSQGLPLTFENTLKAQGAAALSVAGERGPARVPAATPAGLSAEDRLQLLVRGGLLRGALQSTLPPGSRSLAEVLVRTYPQAGGEELCLLVARELLGTLDPAEGRRLEQLRLAHPLSATLVKEHYQEVTEVPPLVFARREELVIAVLDRLSLQAHSEAEPGLPQLPLSPPASSFGGSQMPGSAFAGPTPRQHPNVPSHGTPHASHFAGPPPSNYAGPSNFGGLPPSNYAGPSNFGAPQAPGSNFGAGSGAHALANAPGSDGGRKLPGNISPDDPIAHAMTTRTNKDGTVETVFGPYDILGEIARGGMGIVYRARQRSLKRIVALKVMKEGENASEKQIRRFKRETEAAARLQHPNIVAVHEVGCHEAFHYFTMDLIEGDPLDAIVKRKEKFPVRKVLEIVKETAQAIHYAHGKGIIHRDIKPANVLLDTDGHPKVTDFGLAKQIDHKSMLTRTGAVVGTPFYMPPEQARGDIDLDHRADVYALGVILYELLTLKLPFHGETTMEVYHKILEEEPLPPRRHDSRIDRDVNTIVLKAMNKDCGRRYQTAQALAEDLQRYLDGDPIQARPLGPIGRLIKKSRKNMPVVLVSMVVFLAVCSAVGLIVWKTDQTNTERFNLASRNEWTQFRAEVENHCINARSQVSSAQARLKDRDPQGALADLDDAEQILADLDTLTPDFTNYNSAGQVTDYFTERKPSFDAIMRSVYLERGRALAAGGTAAGYAEALDALSRGQAEHCETPAWSTEPRGTDEEIEKETLARAKLKAGLKVDTRRLQLEEGKVMALQGRSAAALKIFAKILAEDPRSADARLEMGRVFDFSGEQVKALASYSEVIEQDSKVLRAYLLRGETRMTVGRHAEALADFNKVLDLKDDSFEGYLSQGRAHQALGHYGEALESLTEAIDILPSLPDGYLHRANLHFAQRKLPQAIKDYEVAISRSAQCYEAYLGLGRALEWILDYPRAERQYEEILGSTDRNAGKIKALARAALGELHLIRADPYECSLEVDAKVRLENVGADGALGPVAELERLQVESQGLIRERLARARSGLDEAIADRPELVEARLARARLALRESDFATLRAQVDRVVKLLAARPQIRLAQPKDGSRKRGRRGGRDWSEDDWEADGSSKRIVFARGDLPAGEAQALLGMALLAEGELGEARKRFLQALDVDAGNALARGGLGHVLAQEEDEGASDAFADARSLQRQTTDEAGHFYAEGLRFTELAMRSKKPEFYLQARQSFARAWAKNPLHSQALLERARLCATWRAHDVAVRCAEEAVRCDPFLREGHELLGMMFTRDLPAERDPTTKRPLNVLDAGRGKKHFGIAIAVAAEGKEAEGHYGRALALMILAGDATSGPALDQARGDLAKAIETIPTDFKDAEPILINQAMAYLREFAKVCEMTGDGAGAKDALSRVNGVYEKAMEAATEQLRAGQALRDRLNYSEAIKCFDRAIALNPKFDKAYYDRGTCYLKIGNFVPGILDFSRALEINPRIADQVYNKVYQISYVVDLNRVITELNKIVADHPNVSYVVFLRGFFYVAKTEFKQVRREDLELGIADFDRTLELNKGHVTALLYRGFMWMKMAGRESDIKERDACFARAMKDYKDALVLDPGSGISHYLQSLWWAVRSAEIGLGQDEVEFRHRQALDELKTSFASEFKGYERIRNEKGFNPIRNLPEFKKLMSGK
ncbi:MAG: protein kinase [Planctomycetes bacterium]|nr:protein kinase [Planctomycetota bacterium]